MVISMSNTVINLEEIEKERRKPINISLPESLVEYIDDFRKSFILVDENGKESPYPRSYLIEDILVYVLADGERFERFLEWFERDVIGDDEGEEGKED